MARRKLQAIRTKAHRSKAISKPSAPPDPYQDLVAEYLATEVSSPPETEDEDGRSSKRRRVDNNTAQDDEDSVSFENNDDFRPPQKQQYAYNDSDDDVTDEYSDADFEDVVLSEASRAGTSSALKGDLNLTLGGENLEPQKRLSAVRRKALTSADRKLRLEIHKTHVLALIGHVRLRSQWCNDTDVQAAFRGLLPASTRKMFRDDTTQTQWQRSRSLKMGLEKAIEAYKDHFEISARGATRSYWSESSSAQGVDAVPEDIDLPIEKEDFQKLATDRKGSRDVGAQLFCGMLRSLGLDVRLVCSLQPLPIRATFRPAHLAKPMPVVVPFHDTRTGMRQESNTKSASGTNDSPNSVPQGVRRFGQASKKLNPTQTKAPPKKQRIHESSFPVYWVEVFNIADQKWIPVDPLVLKMVDKPTKYEPPANDAENSMSYVVAIDEDGYLKDVTRRYAHAYNARTRLNRVECSKNGHEWWRQVMDIYHDPLPQDRDQMEDAELTAKEAREPMPRNITEFKNHPYYALERHLRQNEVLQPKRQVGTVSSGANKNVEAVYRRNDVHTVRSADAWFRKGMQVKLGELPLKYLEPKKVQGRRTGDEELDDDEPEIPGIHAGTPLFAAFQTQQYSPPPVFAGIIPKNMYGNIDVYTSWMVPAGGVWINHPFAGGAARLLAIDWADAVTGFEFRGRTGTAIVKGVVIAVEYHEAVVETIKGLRFAIEEEENHNRSIEVLQKWKRFLIALRIRQRIQSYHVEGEELEEAAKHQSQSDSEYEDDDDQSSNEEDDNIASGGFLRGSHQDQIDTNEPAIPAPASAIPHIIQKGPDEHHTKAIRDALQPILSTWGESLPEPTIDQMAMASIPDPSMGNEYIDMQGGFFTEDIGDESGGFIPEDESEQENTGGFVPEPELEPELEPNTANDDMSGGGFITEEAPAPSNHQEDDTLMLEHGNVDGISRTTSDQNPGVSETAPLLAATNKSVLARTESADSHKSAGSLLSHDPDDDDVEDGWI